MPDVVVGARRGSPLVLGVGKGENFFASDVSAIVAHTRDAVYLKDYDIAALRATSSKLPALARWPSGFEVSKVEFSEEDVSKGEFAHYMLKEIFEQPNSVRDAMRGRLSREEATAKLGGLEMTNAELRQVERIILTGCGTASHAAMVGEYVIEALAHIPVEVEFASEFRYRNMPLTTRHARLLHQPERRDRGHAGRLAREPAQRPSHARDLQQRRQHDRARKRRRRLYARRPGDRRRGDQIVHLPGHHPHAARPPARPHPLPFRCGGLDIIYELEKLPDKVAMTLELDSQVAAIAEKYAGAKNFLFLGRQFNYPMALEGALKMKEISYIPASGHPSAELKHGVIALMNEETPSLFIAPAKRLREESQQHRGSQGPQRPVIAIGTEGDNARQSGRRRHLIPPSPDYLSPILTAIPLQLLAYHTAVELGCDVDKPRNLAKSVTVE